MNKKSSLILRARVAAVVTLFAIGLSGLGVQAANVALAWNRNTETNLVGYRLYYGTATRSYSASQLVGASVTNATVSNLLAGRTYFFAVAATNMAGLQGTYSSEVSYTTPAVNTAPLANAQSITATQGIAKPIALTGSDADGNALAFAVVTSPSHGVLSGVAPALTYTPAASYTGSDSFTFRVNDGLTNSTAATVAITVAPVVSTTNSPPAVTLPMPWVTTDVGSGALAGNASVSNNAFVVTGSGTIDGMNDTFRFVYQPMNGDGEIVARVAATQLSGSNACAGLMIRESLNSGACVAFLGVAGDRSMRVTSRSNTSSPARSYTYAGNGAPGWLRLVRTANTFVAYQSSDGVTWSRLRSFKVTMAANVVVGLAVGSGTATALGSAIFDLPTALP